MTHFGIRKTEHARRRQQQRGVRDEAMAAALLWGRPISLRGARTAFFLDRRSTESARRRGAELSRFEGTVVVESHDGAVITVIRCRRRFRRQKRER
jgi:hypothetical protein